MNGDLTEDLRVRVNETTREQLEALAEREERSIAQVIRRFIRQGLERERAEDEVTV